MKKSLFATALLVALVGCSKSTDETMGTAAPAESGSSVSTSTEIRRETIVTNDPARIESSRTDVTITPPAQPDVVVTPPAQTDVINTPPAPAQGSPGASVSADVDINTQPAQPAQPDQSQNQNQQPQQPQQPEQGANTTGDQSNGDTSNRPAGNPAGQQPQQPE